MRTVPRRRRLRALRGHPAHFICAMHQDGGLPRAARLPALAAFSYSILRRTLIVAAGLPTYDASALSLAWRANVPINNKGERP